MDMIAFDGFGGLKLAATAFGSPADPAVVLLPSAGQVRETWYPAARSLAEAGRYAICVDLRGHGESAHAMDARYDLDAYAADLRAVLNALPSRAFVVASGLGAVIAIASIGEGTPHLVSGLALIDANIWFDEKVVERMGRALLQRLATANDREAILDGLVRLYPGEPRPQLTERMLAAYTRTEEGRFEWRGDPRAFVKTNLVAEQERLSAAGARIATPVTLVRGSLNDSIPLESTERLQALIKGAEIAEVEGAGHHAAADWEDALNSLLLEFIERAAPRKPLAFLGGSEPRLLRDALGCFGTGVTIVTTVDAGGQPIGLTANSFTSVSLDPPLILFSLAKSSANLQTFVETKGFAVNVLHIGQQPIAGRFATRDVARFDGVDWAIPNDGGSPILAGSLASFDCRTFAVHEGGDHLIFIGEVTHAWFEPNRDPLLYFRGRFRRLHFA